MPTGLKRQLSGGRAEEYERFHAQRRLRRRNAPPWNAEGALAALDVAELMRHRDGSTAAASISMREQLWKLLYFGDEWEEFKRLFLEGRVESNSFWDWYAGWWTVHTAHPEAVLWVHRRRASLVTCSL